MDVIRSKGGTGERSVPLEEIEVPDLWHIGTFLRSERIKEPAMAAAVLECWHLCHDLLRHIQEKS